MQAKDKVYQTVQQILKGRNRITAAELAEQLNLSRQVVSHYLTRLMEDGFVAKTNTRPVYWYLVSDDELEFFDEQSTKEPEAAPKAASGDSVFSALVGYNGSQKQAVEMCKAAVSYPPNGLPMLITGESGVGKSCIARLIYEYALSMGVIGDQAPFVVLNCADYANNPELLSATLLGYKKGSFTGADSDKEGLLGEADGGYLFLDEVHRLSYENQEKLFLFMDTGQYRPLGGRGWKSSQVRFIFATTEKPEEVLLETFRRRITLQIPIPNMMERPVGERMQMLYLFYQKEAKKTGKTIEVEEDVVRRLCFSRLKGNIGKLENLIQVSCANAFYKQPDKEKLIITMKEFPGGEWQSGSKEDYPVSSILVDGKQEWRPEHTGFSDYDVERLTGLWNDIARISYDKMDISADSIYLNFKRLVRAFRSEQPDRVSEQDAMGAELFSGVTIRLLGRYGVRNSKELVPELYFLYRMFGQAQLDSGLAAEMTGFFDRIMPKAFYAAKLLFKTLNDMEQNAGGHVLFLFTLFLHEFMIETMEFHGLIVAHGDSTASSIQKVANQTCGTFVFESIDMPMDTSIQETIHKVHQYLEQINSRKGLILLVDTGSLNQMYSSIKNYLSGDLLIVNNVSTAIALDMGIKMLGRCSFLEIVKAARDTYTFEIQYFEGISRGHNIIVSCMSGVGIAEKIQEVMMKVVDQAEIDIITMDYQELRDLLDRNQREYFQQTKLILTTSALPDRVKVPWLNIYDILDGKGEKMLWNSLKGVISREKFEELKREYIRFFSVEGIVSRLQFLNPTVVINEVELILMKYEQRYRLEMTGHVRLNLYMHIAFMIERLMTSDPKSVQEDKILSPEERRFYGISQEIFADIEKKYRIRVNSYELSLMYELFRRIMTPDQSVSD